jgi:hypothetical protein
MNNSYELAQKLMNMTNGTAMLDILAKQEGITISDVARADFEHRLTTYISTVYTYDDLNHIIALYETPVMKKYLAMQPQFLTDCQKIGYDWAIANNIR